MNTAPFPQLRPARLVRIAALTLTATLLLAPGAVRAQRPNTTQHWVGTWGASPSSVADNAMIAGHAYKGTNQYNNQTIRLIVRTSIGGNLVRVRLSNELGTQALNIGAAHIAVRDGAANIVPGTDRALTFSRSTSVTIPNNAVAVSDPIRLNVPALGDLAVSIYLPDNTTVSTVHELALQTNYVSPSGGGDATGATTFPLDPTAPTTDQWPILTAVEVLGGSTAKALVTFGDSITDGVGSPANTNQRWPYFLAQRLLAVDQLVGVVDEGISGNRVLNDQVGPNGLRRYERDALIVGNATFLTDLLGINDLGLDPTIDPNVVIAGKRQFIARAHSLGLKIYGCTLLPCSSSVLPHGGAANNAKRLLINDFIRSGAYDGVIDFDAATKDPANPGNLNPLYDSGDGLHPNEVGYQAMANAINLALFQ